jgi:signal transduction histidine kinase
MAIVTTSARQAREVREFTISTLAPGPWQQRVALGFVVVLAIASVMIVAWFGSIRLRRIDAIIPAFSTAMFITDLLTASLLFAQFSILRMRALIAIATGYLYTGFIIVPWTLTFPGTFAPGGLLGAGLQTTIWLYVFWHAGFPLFVMSYALLKGGDQAKDVWHGSVQLAVFLGIAIATSLVAALTILVTAGHDLMPGLSVDTIYSSHLWRVTAICAAVVAALAGVVLWRRRGSVLDLWLSVVIFSFFLELLLASGLAGRFSVEWYATRVLGILSANFVLFALLYETTTLYGRLLRALSAERRERNARLVIGDAISATIAHEVRQPLTAMTTNANAGLRWLGREIPDLDEAKASLQRIVNDGHRAGAVIENIRTIFQKDSGHRTAIDISELVTETLEIVRSELRTHRVFASTKFAARLPRVNGDQTRLQQVLLNLIANAIDAMAAIQDRERILRILCDRHESGGVVMSVEDSGRGIRPSEIDHIFDPFFTTKPEGMGMGLALCRSIAEAHGGSLCAVANGSEGAIFQLVIPAHSS